VVFAGKAGVCCPAAKAVCYSRRKGETPPAIPNGTTEGAGLTLRSEGQILTLDLNLTGLLCQQVIGKLAGSLRDDDLTLLWERFSVRSVHGEVTTPEHLLAWELEFLHEARLIDIGGLHLAERHGVKGDPHAWDNPTDLGVEHPSPVTDVVRLVEAPEPH